MKRLHPVAAICLLLSACGADDDAEDGGSAGLRVVTIGDNVASNPTYATGWASLLVENDGELFPSFAGKDLRSQHGDDLSVVRLDRGGDGYRPLAASPDSLCTCSAEAGDCPVPPTPCVDTDHPGDSLVIVGLGINDVFSLLLRMLSDAALLDDPSPAVDALEDDIAAVIDRAAGPDFADVAGGGRLVVLNTYDPTDGTGSVSQIAAPLIPFDDIELITPALALGMLSDVNAAIAAATVAAGGAVVDAHAHFLGHGMSFDDADNPHHDQADPTFWLRGFLDPNLRGAHELRRLIWEAATGEAVDVIPTDLPIGGELGLPEIPDDGWAKAVVDSDIPDSLTDDAGTAYDNVVADPSELLGAPDASILSGMVALGVVGNWIVVDMGEGTEVTDDYRCFIVDPQLEEDVFLTAYEVLPGEPRVVHHVILFALTTDAADAVAQDYDDRSEGLGYTCFGGALAPSSAIGGWAPGGGATRHPAQTGVKLTAGRRMVMQVHYNLRQGALPDRTRVALEVESSVQTQGLIFGVADTTLEVPPGKPAHETVAEYDLRGFGLPLGMNLRGAFPHMHELGVSMRVEAVRGDVTRCLFDVPRWDFDWQQFYFYDSPIYVYPDETLRISCTYDTTSRTEPVTWGEGTQDEMCLAGFYVTPF